MSSPLIQDDTIVAIATPPGEGGIGILRLSGPQALQVLSRVFRGKREISTFESHKLHYGQFLHPQTKEVIDSGMAVWMQAPHSYTGEEVVEIHAHGGPFVLNHLLQIFVEAGLRVAEPGEFTRRAFLNGKLDLLQAEAVGEMIHAKSEAALRNARDQLSGRLSEQVAGVRQRVIQLLARVEAAIDFPEEDIEILSPKETLAELGALHQVLREWLDKFHIGRMVREGVRLALVGRPNVGKSSLLNKLMGEERAIVHHKPGTTRDVVEGWMNLEGISFQLFDTAGIREGEGAVEQEGIRRARKTAEHADLTLWILDASSPLSEEDRHIASTLHDQVLLVGNKIDLGIVVQTLPEKWGFCLKNAQPEWVLVSAWTGEGLETLKQAILRIIGLETLSEKSHGFLNNARHLAAIQEASSSLIRAKQALEGHLAAECVAADLQQTAHALEALLGRISTEDVLDEIFSSFCIGK